MEMILDPKTQMLVALGAAVAAKCQACFSTLYSTAEKVDATDSEIRAVVALAHMVTEKSQGFMAAFVEEATDGRVPAANEGEETEGGCGCG
jgi:AhpD family alkylhydroperoxidase